MSVVERVETCLARPGMPPPGARVVVGVSGGLDSCALLHVLRFALPGRLQPVAAHFDHAMRPGSAEDALWVRGLCRAWDLPLRSERASEPLASEADARAARYAFLERARRAERVEAILTAHHADDQAETVLFRVLRGTGVEGLAGIPALRDGAVVRPLLEVWREELESYAARARLSWREDASNAGLSRARNALRHRLIPDAERLVAPGARQALVRLARNAAAHATASREALDVVLQTLGAEHAPGEISFDRGAVAGLGEEARGLALRALARSLGRTLDEVGTRRAVEFSSSGRSGGCLELGDGLELRRRLERLVLVRHAARAPDRPLSIPDAGPGSGDAWLGGKRIPVSWGGESIAGHERVERLEISADRFPILVRGRRPGDRIRLPGGTRKVKKVLLEARIPSDRREAVPIVVDARGEVLWVPGVARSVLAGGSGERSTLTIGIG